MAFTEGSELLVFPKVGQRLTHHGDDDRPRHYCICRQPGGAAFDITGASVQVKLIDRKARGATLTAAGTISDAPAGEFYFGLTAADGAAMRPPSEWSMRTRLTSSATELTSANEVVLEHKRLGT